MTFPATMFTLVSALLFAATFLLGKWLRAPSHHAAKRNLVSMAAGASVGYVFIDIFPAMERMRQSLIAAMPHEPPPYEGKIVYVAAMAGFLLFYGLERVMVRAEALSHEGRASAHTEAKWLRRLDIGAFAVYVWMVGYFLVRTPERTPMALVLYTGAMGLHFLSLNYNLRREHGPSYDRGPAWVLAASALGGWLCGILVDIPLLLEIGLVSMVIGGLLVNTMVEELAESDEGHFVPMSIGALAYAFLLLVAH